MENCIYFLGRLPPKHFGIVAMQGWAPGFSPEAARFATRAAGCNPWRKLQYSAAFKPPIAHEAQAAQHE
jgi:hypothetical protein